MRLIKWLLGTIAIFLLIVLGITNYLGPDSLRLCNGPGGSGNCAKADAIVVISGGDTAARTAEAVNLYNKEWAPVIIFSGAAADKSGPSNAKVMQRQAIDAGVSPQNTAIEELSNTTDQNAQYVMKMVKANNYQSIILVTSGYHERRAMLQFQHYAENADGSKVEIRTHPVAEDKDWGKYWWLTARGWGLAFNEIAKNAVVTSGGVDTAE